jgi:beta-glucanase (GH16 family)
VLPYGYDFGVTRRSGQAGHQPWKGKALVNFGMKRMTTFVVGLAVSTALLATTACVPQDEPGWKLAWYDEFNGSAGSGPDQASWVFDRGGEPSWGNNEWQYYTNRPENVSHTGSGALAITARRERLPGMDNCQYGTCDITSGRIKTKGKVEQAYGRFEARIKIPGGAGIWPAFWMLGDNIDQVSWPKSGEIDVMEAVGKEPGTAYGTAHGDGFSKGGSKSLPNGQRLADDFHVYRIDWDPSSITWYLDGAQYFRLRKTDLAPGQVWPFDHEFFLLLNVAVGGRWPGPPDGSTPFPATMLVDYVRLYQPA